jgi:hypothetical protein
MLETEDVAALWHGCRLLRLTKDRASLLNSIFSLMQSPCLRSRETGVVIAGWQPEQELEKRLRTFFQQEPQPTLQSSARAALRRRRLEGIALDLLGSLAEAPPNRWWALADAFSKLADPWLAWCWEERLWVGDLLGTVDPPQAGFLKKRLKEAKEKAEKDVKNARRAEL